MVYLYHGDSAPLRNAAIALQADRPLDRTLFGPDGDLLAILAREVPIGESAI